MSEAEYPGIRFGFEPTAIRNRLFISAPWYIFDRVRGASASPDFSKLITTPKKAGAIQLATRGDIVTTYLNVSKLKRQGGTHAQEVLHERKMAAIAHVVSAFQYETAEYERDPLLQAFIGRPSAAKPDYPMWARLTIPNAINRSSLTNEANAHHFNAAYDLGYEPKGGGSGLHILDKHAYYSWSVLADSQPSRGIEEVARSHDDTGTTVDFRERGLTSHTEQVMCLAGLVGAVQVIRDRSDATVAVADLAFS